MLACAFTTMKSYAHVAEETSDWVALNVCSSLDQAYSGRQKQRVCTLTAPFAGTVRTNFGGHSP